MIQHAYAGLENILILFQVNAGNMGVEHSHTDIALLKMKKQQLCIAWMCLAQMTGDA